MDTPESTLRALHVLRRKLRHSQLKKGNRNIVEMASPHQHHSRKLKLTKLARKIKAG